MTDTLVLALIEANLPQVLYLEKDQKWELGSYDIQVKRSGQAAFSSTLNYLSLTLPIEVVIQGQVNKSLLGRKIVMHCSSTFSSETRLDIEPKLNPDGSSAAVEISVPIPNQAYLYCDGIKLPIQVLLAQIVANKKAEWEQKLESDIAVLFKQVGL